MYQLASPPIYQLASLHVPTASARERSR